MPGRENDSQTAEPAIILTIIDGSEIDFGKHFLLEKARTSIGREPRNEISLCDEKISKVHCEINVSKNDQGNEIFFIRDLDSTNGTYVNGEWAAQASLNAGDKIQIGDTVLRLSCNDEVEKEYHSKLFNFAVRDIATGLYNKRYVINELENYMRIARRSGRAFSIILIDIDDFKQLNDRYGHMSGDEYLIHLAKLLMNSLREQDIAGRIGGEEFLAVLPETDGKGAFQLAVRIKNAVEKFILKHQRFEIRTTISAGVCQYENGMHGVKDLIDRADQALYEAKKSGKNTVLQAAPATKN
jgi:diguanylate cyclase (GGDEF)-like protein